MTQLGLQEWFMNLAKQPRFVASMIYAEPVNTTDSTARSASSQTYLVVFQSHEIVMFESLCIILSCTSNELGLRDDFTNVFHDERVSAAQQINNRPDQTVIRHLLR